VKGLLLVWENMVWLMVERVISNELCWNGLRILNF
jgi:hypothetical protein